MDMRIQFLGVLAELNEATLVMSGTASVSLDRVRLRRTMKKTTLAIKKAPTITATAIPAFSATLRPPDD